MMDRVDSSIMVDSGHERVVYTSSMIDSMVDIRGKVLEGVSFSLSIDGNSTQKDLR